MTPISHTDKTSRNTHIDAIRGVAVLFMIFAHGIFFFYSGDSFWVRSIERFLNTVTLSVFLFVSGMATAQKLHPDTRQPRKETMKNLTKYLLQIYITYSALTIAAILLQQPNLTGQDLTRQIVMALVLIAPPSFMEYIPLFIVLPVITYAISPVLRRIKHSGLYLLNTSAAVYLIGLIMYSSVGWPEELSLLKAVLAGQEGALQFPLLFYLPVFFTGFWWNTHASLRHVAYVLLGTAGIGILSIFSANPLFSLTTRWPPSAGFLAMGILASVCLYAVVKISPKFFTVFITIGKDSLDFWFTHLLVLFFYARFLSYMTDNIVLLAAFVLGLICITAGISTNGFNRFRSAKHIAHTEVYPLSARRSRKRYALVIFAGILVLTIMTAYSNNSSSYGSFMPADTGFGNTTEIQNISLTSSRTWHLFGMPENEIQLIAKVSGNRLDAILDNLSKFEVVSDTSLIKPFQIKYQPDTVSISIPTTVFKAGSHELLVRFTDGNQIISSNRVRIHVSEPLFVAWTFDWEGWEPDPSAMMKIKELSERYSPIHFTHFVSPRTFITDSIADSRKAEIQEFLLQRKQTGDEIALHIHMHYDLVELAGIPVKHTTHWGLRSQEGYDVPTTEYSPEEFRSIVIAGRQILEKQGFGEISGYRAGGWYINSPQLAILGQLGFSYDSSGRSRPKFGVFKNTPWNLTENSGPYSPNVDDQNISSSSKDGSILEIPNNGLSTYESSIDELTGRIKLFYSGDELAEPKALVYVSHPQFANKEFGKITPVLDELQRISFRNDSGPVVFTTTGDINTLWKTFNR